ncbi:hypothetical protein [Tengunoibacter tsumagoiensis]|uniref:Uncharacterized protein n=1 Tax=Tengunoibacter tsumagoiensis TaxID=2014871 RepID=A0A401ZZ07_9CHLR|nr:hypothetical protein [Tengunoibacter tsumagoiensis]GCE12075.1 hypothetical protein KTT_19340 [Tengunoibacter tsumagoiensis]
MAQAPVHHIEIVDQPEEVTSTNKANAWITLSLFLFLTTLGILYLIRQLNPKQDDSL